MFILYIIIFCLFLYLFLSPWCLPTRINLHKDRNLFFFSHLEHLTQCLAFSKFSETLVESIYEGLSHSPIPPHTLPHLHNSSILKWFYKFVDINECNRFCLGQPRRGNWKMSTECVLNKSTHMRACSDVSDSFVTPWTLAHQEPLSMKFPKQENWSGLPFPPPSSSWGIFPTQGSNPSLLEFLSLQADSLPLSPSRKPSHKVRVGVKYHFVNYNHNRMNLSFCRN